MAVESDNSGLTQRMSSNADTLRNFYRLAAGLLVLTLVLHIGYSAYFLQTERIASYPRVALFAVVSVSALVVEILLARVAFMLAARAGQLFDTLYAIDIGSGSLDIQRLEAAARVVTMLRRSESALRVLDVEQIANAAASAAKN